MTHTPGGQTNSVSLQLCGCTAEISDVGGRHDFKMKYCPLHEAAPEQQATIDRLEVERADSLEALVGIAHYLNIVIAGAKLSDHTREFLNSAYNLAAKAVNLDKAQ